MRAGPTARIPQSEDQPRLCRERRRAASDFQLQISSSLPPQICGLIYRQTCLIFLTVSSVASSLRSLLGFGHIPASAAIAESFPPAIGHGNRILEFDEAALRM